MAERPHLTHTARMLASFGQEFSLRLAKKPTLEERIKLRNYQAETTRDFVTEMRTKSSDISVHLVLMNHRRK